MNHHYNRLLYSAAVLCLSLVTACSPRRSIVSAPQETVPPPRGAASVRADPIDPFAEVLIRARELSDGGDAALRSGNFQEARSDFQAALDLLWDYSRERESNFRIAREVDYLIVRLETLDAAVEPVGAAIDDLANVEPPTGGLDPAFRERVTSDVERFESGFPIRLDDRVVAFLEYYTQGRGRATIQAGLERAGRYAPMIHQILAEEGLPQELFHLAQAESAFKPEAISRAAARGMWQFISSRGQEYGLRQTFWIDERSDPEKSTRAAARHLKDLYDRFGDWYLAMAAYNAGPVRVSEAIERAGVRDFWTLARENLLPLETRNYVPTILAMALIGRDPARYGFDIQPAENEEVERVPLREATDLRVIAGALDLPVEEIHRLNPHVLRWATPPEDDAFELILPSGYRGIFEERVAPLAAGERILFEYHVVSDGETLSQISQQHGISISAIAEANHLVDPHLIRVGQSLVVPTSEGQRADTAAARAPKVVYSVRSGDTLTRIAGFYGTSVEAIRTWNLELDLNIIHPGDQITIYCTAETIC